MDDFDVGSRRAKKDRGKFGFEDLSIFIQEQVRPDAKVTRLPVGKWVKVGNLWLLNKCVRADLDDAFALIVTQPDRPFLNWLYLPKAAVQEGTWVTWWRKIPDTNLILDVWYVGDGSPGVVLVVNDD